MTRSGLSSAAGVDAFTNTSNTTFVDALGAAPDSSAALCRVVPLRDFRPAEVTTRKFSIVLGQHARGAMAPVASIGLSEAEGWKLARFTAHAAWDEQDMIDAKVPVDLTQLVIAEMAAAALAVKANLVWTALLSNGEMADGEAIFSAAHANIASGGGSALSSTSLATAFGALGRQVRTDPDGTPCHLNQKPAVLTVPPELYFAALALNVLIGSPLKVQQESRLCNIGVPDPLGDTTILGNNTNWLLSAGTSHPGILLGALDGNASPRLRISKLTNGRWGFAADVVADYAVMVADHKPLYWSVGQ